MSFEHDELAGRIHSIFSPEPVVGNEGEEWHERPPSQRLKTEYGLDTTYWKPFEYGSTSPLMRRAAISDSELAGAIQAQEVPRELFIGTFRLFGDSILAYHEKPERSGPYRFYPAVLMSAWASFEAFVRIYSELLAKTVPGLPAIVQQQLLEREEWLDDKGQVRTRSKVQPLLTRYWWLLKFGYACVYDRGGQIWQMGKEAFDKRNELVHYKVSDMPSLRAAGLWQHLEAILLLLIGPSAQIRKTVMPDEYELYGMLDDLQPLIEDYEERPFFKDNPVKLDAVIFPCPFNNVDNAKFPVLLARNGSEL
jgi:hypothetical protein